MVHKTWAINYSKCQLIPVCFAGSGIINSFNIIIIILDPKIHIFPLRSDNYVLSY